MILVTGATGHLGSETIKHLVKLVNISQLVAFARDAKKADSIKKMGIEVRIGDFDNKESLKKALQGIEKVFLVSTIDPNRFQQHKNVIDASKEAGVKHIVYTSVSMRDIDSSAIKELMESHFQTESYLQESGIPYTILRNTLYTDGIPMFVGEQVFNNGIYLPAGNGKVPYALRREMGEASANVLVQDIHKNKVYEITGSALYSYEDVARELSSLSGEEVSYVAADENSYAEELKKLQLPDPVVYLLTGFSKDISNKQFEKLSSDLETLLGRKPASLREGLQELYHL
jgi:NAD(P)H dehydrogenase (quinone)